MRCYDGFKMSVQASAERLCTPKDDQGPYTHVEVGRPSELEELLMPYAYAPSMIVGMRPVLYANVPAAVIRAVLEKHAGMVTGQMPELVTTEMAGRKAVTDGGNDSEEDGEEESSGEEASVGDEDGEMDPCAALTSVMQLGAPPPMPPQWPPHQKVTATAAEAEMELSDEDEGMYDEDGCMWAAPAPTGDSATGPSVAAARAGPISPPISLMNVTLSPIRTEEEKQSDATKKT